MASKVSKTPARPVASGMEASTGGGGRPKPEGSWMKGLVTLIVVLIIIGGGIYLVSSYTGIDRNLLPGATTFKSEWQAVFLTNGQVYFGQVTKMDVEFIHLDDIYYLQVVNLQDTIGQPPDVQQQPEQRLTLIKLGNEIHGPQDKMLINRDHIVIIEDLKDDSRVVTAIADYLSGETPEPL